MGLRFVRVIPILVGVIVGCAVPGATASSEWPRIAIRGYDPVAYFATGRPSHGNQEYIHAWRGAMYYFATPSHRDSFIAEPDRYAPQFAGFCVLGLTEGAKLEGDPEAWSIVNGKLYVTYNKAARDVLLADPAAAIAKAEANWKTLAH